MSNYLTQSIHASEMARKICRELEKRYPNGIWLGPDVFIAEPTDEERRIYEQAKIRREL